MSCCITELRETNCETPDISGVIWFKCAYQTCHAGIGRVIIKNSTGNQLYRGCPTGGTQKLTWVQFNPNDLSQGGTIDVNYDGSCGLGHKCNGAVFDYGYATDLLNPIGRADMNNERDGGLRYNHGILPPLTWPTTPPAVSTSKQICFTKQYSCSEVSTKPAAVCQPYVYLGESGDFMIQPESIQTISNPLNRAAVVQIYGDVDDDLVINGTVIDPDYSAGSIFYSFPIPNGGTFTIGIQNGIGPCVANLNVCFI